MGLFSKLLGSAGADADKALDLVKGLVKDAVDEAERAKAQGTAPSSAPSSAQTYAPAPADREADGPSGFSWGPVMPAEENQFSFPGTPVQYFTQIYDAEFPEYRVTGEPAYGGKATVFTFTKDGKTALIVELLPSSSGAKKLRRDCRAQGIPYLRFYYDYDGWWNTRSYVTQRTRNALGG